jgi:uncharacterized protein YggE
MKLLRLVLPVLLLSTAHLVANEIQPPHITVSGTAVTEVVPDEMLWSLEVQDKHASLENAARDHAKSVEAVLSLLKGLDLDQKHIQTSRMEFGENRELTSGSWIKSGYFSKTAVSFKLTDFDLYQRLWAGLARIPGVSIQGVSYDHSKRIEHRKDARRKALETAKEKASEMARTLGAEIGEPLVVEEDSLGSEWFSANSLANNVRTVGDGNTRDDHQLALGTIPIRAQVKVSFRLLTPRQ